MKRKCCDSACSQGRDCPMRPARAVKIPTRRAIWRRALAAAGEALDRYKFLPMLIALVLLYIVNS